MRAAPAVHAAFDEASHTITYLVWDPATGEGAVIDPVLDFDYASAGIDTRSADRLLDEAARRGVRIGRILETHVHADHLTAARYLRKRTGARVAIGEHVRAVQATFAPMFGAADLAPDSGDFDDLLVDGQRLALGRLDIEVLHTPGHTPACVSYRIGEAVFVGDTLFMPDYGTARTDFPGGDARTLYRSIRRLLGLPPETRLYMCHDYGAPGRPAFAWETTVGAQRDGNVQIRDGVSEDDFVALRQARDAGLAAPTLLLPSIQVNIRGGRLPPARPDGRRALTVPLRFADAAVAAAL